MQELIAAIYRLTPGDYVGLSLVNEMWCLLKKAKCV